MGRAILAVVAGYATMFVVVFAGLTGAYLGIGADRAFEPGSYEVSKVWLGVWLAVSVIAAVLGGVVCGKIARTMTPVWVLVGLVVVLGALQAGGVALSPKPTPAELARAGDVPNMEAMMKARSPLWVAVMNPLIGGAGVVAGAGTTRRREAPAP